VGRRQHLQQDFFEGRTFVDNATKRELKQPDQFVTLTEHGLEWAKQNRRSAVVTSVVLLLVIVAAVGGAWIYNYRSDQANAALGDAMHTYQTPVAAPGQAVPPGTKTFSSVQERAKAANPQFVDVANRYGMTKDGGVARYFAGLTYMDQGQNQPAEDALKQVSGSWNHNLAALAKLALAQLYRGSGRDSQAIALYQELSNGNADTVPPGMAQIQLAEMYESQGKDADAKKIYAQLVDKDKDPKGKPGPIAALAKEKLNPQPAAGPLGGEQ
jgi:tetratricopeptide (TPR) repeat protein